MHMAGEIPVTDPAGFSLYQVVTRGREYLPAPWNIRDTEAPRKSYYDRIIKPLLDSNARSQALACNLCRESTLIEFLSKVLKFAQSLSIKALFESLWISDKE